MAGRSFNIAAVFTGDVSQLKTATQDARREMVSVGDAVERTSAQLDRQAQSYGQAEISARGAAAGAAEFAGSGARAAKTATALGAGYTAALRPLTSLTAATVGQTTALQAALAASAGFTQSIGKQADAMLQNSRASAAYQAELDGVRAKYNPIFALSRQYEQQLREIADAERLGAISANEAAAARERAARIIAPTPVAARVPDSPAPSPDETEALRSRYMPLYAAEQRYNRELDELRRARDLGAVSDEEMIGVQERLQLAYGETVERIRRSEPALRGQGQAMRLNAHEARNLSYQLSDTFQTLALGMPIQQVLLQQGPQIVDIYDGVGNTFRALRAALTPARLALGGTAAAALLGATAWNSYLVSVKEVQTAAAGLGRATAAPAATLEAAARAGADTAGISVQAARSMQAEFLRTGRIGSENFEGLIGVSKDFAATLGIDAKAAGGALAEMFADPAKGADTLYQKYGLIDAATMRQVRTLSEQNRATEAQTLLLERLQPRLVDAAEATTLLSQAWQSVKAAASDAGNAIGGAIDRVFSGPTREEELENRIAELQAILSQINRGSGHNYRNLPDDVRARRAAEAQAELDQAELELASRRAAETRRQAMAAAAAKGRTALGIANASPTQARRLQEETLRNEIIALQEGQNARGLDQVQRDAIATSIDAKSRALDALVNRQERTLELDRLDIQIANERNPLYRAELEARRTRLQLSEQEISQDALSAEVSRARTRVIEESLASSRQQASDMQAELEARNRLTALVSAGIVTSEEANRLLQEELALRPLVAAAAAAEGEEKARLLQVLDELRAAYDATAEADRAARAAEAGQERLRSQRDRLEMMRIEIGLIGQSAAVQARTLALARAEQDIHSMKLDPKGALAGQIRENEVQLAELERSLERQREAWDSVQGSAEAAIDGIASKLTGGDITGALESLASEVTGLFTELAVTNPLKNALLGTDYGTLDDVGGLKGIYDRLTGKQTPQGKIFASDAAGPSLSSMAISAGTVTISAGSLGFGAAGQLPSAAANLSGAPLGGSSEVQSQVWRFFQGKGLAPHQIAGIMGNVSAESAFNPLAVGDSGTSFGLFQHHAGRGQSLLNSVGGAGGLGNVEGQLAHVWSELQGSESGVLKRLLASTNVQEATAAFTGFERPQGWTSADPTGAHNWAGRLSGAEQAMSKFSTAAEMATGDLGTLGQGFNGLGSMLSGIGLGGAGGSTGGGDLVWSIVSGIAGAAGIPGFRTGGDTGGSDPSRVAGVVHEQEYVFDAAATRRIGVRNLEALRKGVLRGYQTGGFVQSVPQLPQAASYGPEAQPALGQVPIVVNDYAGAGVQAEVQPDGRGGRQILMTIGEQTAAAMRQPGNPANRALQQRGVKERPIGR